MTIVRSFLKLAGQYPYGSLTPKGGPFGAGKLRLLQYVLLFACPRYFFQKMSIVPLVKRAYKLSGDKEFLVRYYVSREGFTELWNTRPRKTQADVESFYAEHDKDIWRQAFLSRGEYNYKKKILRVYHLIAAEGLSSNDPILDYGGGAGVLVHYLASKGYRAVDIADIPSQTLDFVRAQMSSQLRHVIAVDGTEDFGVNRYAVITTLDCLEHTFEPLIIIKKLLTALRPGGLLVINFPQETDFSNAHIPEAQAQRDAVFAFINQQCTVITSELVYRKKS